MSAGLVYCQQEATVPPTMEEVFEGKGTFGVQTAICDGDGQFSGEASYDGEGEFMSEGGTFSGDGIFFISGGTFSTSNPEEKWTCEGRAPLSFQQRTHRPSLAATVLSVEMAPFQHRLALSKAKARMRVIKSSSQ